MLNESKYNSPAAVNKDSGKSIPIDEPVFLIRARDKHSFSVLADYMCKCSDPDHKDAIFQASIKFNDWQRANRDLVKEPD